MKYMRGAENRIKIIYFKIHRYSMDTVQKNLDIKPSIKPQNGSCQ